jgi:protein SCO1/2
MADTPESFSRTLWIGLILMFGLLAIAGLLSLAEVGTKKIPLRIISQVSDFTLTNEDGQATTLADLTNHVWVADIIFTRCAGPCPSMTEQMKAMTGLVPPDSNVRFVTLTTDPDYDSPEVLKRYGQRFGADFHRWLFLTGSKSEVAGLAAGGLKLGSTPVAPADQKGAADLFIHTTIFVLVDKHARLRGIFETGGDGVDWENKIRPDLLTAIRQLEREP